jgi:hypothetical protein
MSDQSNLAEHWIVERHPFTKECPPRGFLQLCADRRFHALLQRQFQNDARLPTPEDYWIHADAGGTPKMRDQKTTPDYCYGPNEVRLMGWSAHGDKCGGFGEDVKDDVIQKALCETMQKNVRDYPLAKHFIYFVTIIDGQTVLSKLIAEPGQDIACTQPD